MEGEVRMSVYQEAYKLPEFKYEYERLKVDVRGPIHVVSFDDAANLNAMSYQQMADFNDYLKKVRMDPECRVIVLTGEGKSFCAGFNLNELNFEPPADMGALSAITASCRPSAPTRPLTCATLCSPSSVLSRAMQ